MIETEPKVFLVGETRLEEQGLQDYLTYLGVPDWKSNAESEPEKLIEVMGRLCYRSFKPGMNANVTKVREDNTEYLQNIIQVKHGSVIEHASVNFIFANVSRVFTHELVRHRAGTAISQESLRFVRLDNIGFWAPTVIREDSRFMEIATNTVKKLEEIQIDLAKMLDLDSLPFKEKKILTSAMRRLAPEGLSTTIGWTANMRALRHCIEMRTDPTAEEEIRLVFGQVGNLMKAKFPALFADYVVETVNGLPWFKTEHRKV